MPIKRLIARNRSAELFYLAVRCAAIFSTGMTPSQRQNSMNNEFNCVPIHTLGGELMGVDVSVRPEGGSLNDRLAAHHHYEQLSFVEKQDLLLNQLLVIEQYADFFRQHRLLCSLNIDFHLARAVVESSFIQQILSHLPFIRLKLSEEFPNLHDGLSNPLIRTLVERLNILWLDDLGAGYANLHALQSRVFEAVKLDRRFYLENVQKPFFPVLIANIRRYTNQVIIEGVESELQLEALRSSKIWGVQGYFESSLPLESLAFCQN